MVFYYINKRKISANLLGKIYKLSSNNSLPIAFSISAKAGFVSAGTITLTIN